jgi:hypothetical protein
MRLNGGVMSGTPQADILGPSEGIGEGRRRSINDHGALPRCIVRLTTARGRPHLATASHDLVARTIKGTNPNHVRPPVRKREAPNARFLQPLRTRNDLLGDDASGGMASCRHVERAHVEHFEEEALAARDGTVRVVRG